MLGCCCWVVPPYTITGIIDDVSTPATIYLAVPYAGTVKKVVTVLAGAITSADSTVTVRDAAASSMGTITVTHTSSAAGDTDLLEPVSNNTLANNSRNQIDTDGDSSNNSKLYVTVYIQGS